MSRILIAVIALSIVSVVAGALILARQDSSTAPPVPRVVAQPTAVDRQAQAEAAFLQQYEQLRAESRRTASSREAASRAEFLRQYEQLRADATAAR